MMMHRNNVKKEKNRLKKLNEIAKQQNCTISKYEFCDNFVLGLDETKKHAFFYKQKKEATVSKYVNLSEIKICQVTKRRRPQGNNKEDLSFIEKIDLSFISTDKNKTIVSFELYNEDDAELRGELQFSKKWVDIINNLLK